MRKERRGKEHATTMHVIKIHVLLTLVVLLNLASMNFVPIRNVRASGACTILLLAAVLQSHLLDRWLKQSRKHLATLTVFKYSDVKQNWCHDQADSQPPACRWTRDTLCAFLHQQRTLRAYSCFLNALAP